MTDIELRAFLNLLMCSDPSPLNSVEEWTMKQFADAESRRHGYKDWITAYLELEVL